MGFEIIISYLKFSIILTFIFHFYKQVTAQKINIIMYSNKYLIKCFKTVNLTFNLYCFVYFKIKLLYGSLS